MAVATDGVVERRRPTHDRTPAGPRSPLAPAAIGRLVRPVPRGPARRPGDHLARRAVAQRRVCGRPDPRPVRPARDAVHAVHEHAGPGLRRHAHVPARGLPARLRPRDPGRGVEDGAHGPHRHPAVDELPDPDLRVDVHPGLQWGPADPRDVRDRCPAPQHAVRRAARHRLQLPAAHGAADLRQPRAARPLVPRGVA